MPRELGDGHLQAKAQAEVGHLVLAGVARRHDLALDAADAEAAGHQHAVGGFEPGGDLLLLERLGVHPDDLHVAAVMDGRVLERLDDAQIGVLQLDVLAHQGDAHRAAGGLDLVDQSDPLAQLGPPGLQTQLVHHEAIQALVPQVERHEVDVGSVHAADDGPRLDVGEERDLLLEVRADGAVGAADDDVGLDTDAAQLVDAVLGGLGLELAGWPG